MMALELALQMYDELDALYEVSFRDPLLQVAQKLSGTQLGLVRQCCTLIVCMLTFHRILPALTFRGNQLCRLG